MPGNSAKELPFTDRGWLDSRTRLEAIPVKGTSIIQISLASTNAEWAAKVVNRAVELYQEQQIKVRKTQGIEKFYDEQDQRLRTDLLKAEQDLKAFQQREGIVDAAVEVSSSLSGLAVAEKSLKDTESLIRETEKRVGILEIQLKGQQPTVSSSKNITTDPAYASIRTRLTQLELERQSLLQRYLPKDRLVLDKEREIAELKKQLDQAEKTAVGSENISLNSVHQRILNELLAARVQLQALLEKRASDSSQVTSYSETAAVKKKKSFEFDRLQQSSQCQKGGAGDVQKTSRRGAYFRRHGRTKIRQRVYSREGRLASAAVWKRHSAMDYRHYVFRRRRVHWLRFCDELF